MYTGEYFPRKLPGQRSLEHDPSVPAVDDSGIQLLKHARIYTLAQKWGVAALQTLSSSKIYCINSTVKGEIEYARYIYAHTAVDDTTIRAPVANFWATRSHTLRSEAEDEFKALCLEFPQFGFDILSKSLLLTRYNHERADATNTLQRACWTTSSRGSATKRCTLHLPAFASVLGTAVVVCNKIKRNVFPCTAILQFFFSRAWVLVFDACILLNLALEAMLDAFHGSVPIGRGNLDAMLLLDYLLAWRNSFAGMDLDSGLRFWQRRGTANVACLIPMLSLSSQ